VDFYRRQQLGNLVLSHRDPLYSFLYLSQGVAVQSQQVGVELADNAVALLEQRRRLGGHLGRQGASIALEQVEDTL
jgi:hypothetical protein